MSRLSKLIAGRGLPRRLKPQSVVRRSLGTLRRATGFILDKGWWIAAAVTIALIWAPQWAIKRLDHLAYDALAGDLMSSSTFSRWQQAFAPSIATGVGGANATKSDERVPLWVAPPPHRAAGVPGSALIVAIDDISLQALGPWPWPRSRHAALIDALEDAGVSSLTYDVHFVEASEDPSGVEDDALITAVARHHNIILPVQPTPGTTVEGPMPALRRNVAALGHAALALDDDGASRLAYLDMQIGKQWIPSLPLATWNFNLADGAANVATRDRAATIVTTPRSNGDLLIGKQASQAHAQAGRQVLMAAGGARVPEVSAAQVMMDPQARIDLRGRAVWVGVTAMGLSMPISTPAARPEMQWSRLRWQAQTYEALRTDQFIHPLDRALVTCTALPPLLLMALLVGRGTGATRGRWGLVLILLPLASTVLLLLFARAWMPPAAATLGWLLGYTLWRGRHLAIQREALDRWQLRADATLHAIADAVITVDGRGSIEYANPVILQWLGVPQRAVRGRPLEAIGGLNEEARGALALLVSDCLHRLEWSKLDKPMRFQSAGGMRLVTATATPVLVSEDTPGAWSASGPFPGAGGAVLILTDVTERVQSERRLRHEASHDALTGLFNRAGLAEKLREALDQRGRPDECLGILFLDLDRFKRINDSLGHHHGDTVLRTVAQRLDKACLGRDTVARWGGDEFVVLTHDCESLAQRAQEIVDVVSTDIHVDGIEVQCGCSVGIAMAPEDGTTLEDLLAAADKAMYLSKSLGGRRFAFSDHEPQVWSRSALRLEHRLRRSLDDGSFALHYQPQIQLTSGETVGMEALLRWNQPDGSVWTPPRFLDVAESSDIILPLGEWVLRQAVSQVAVWLRLGMTVVPVSVNVSARQCLDMHLVALMRRILAEYDVPPALIKVEVTETTAMSDVTHVSALLHDLRRLGVAVAVDDFGTGYSSLAHLRRLPVDQLKIDQSFVRDITQDRYGAAVVRAMIGLAHELGVPVVAEGVESESQKNFLMLNQCDMGQGFYYAQALDQGAATEHLQLQRFANDGLMRVNENLH